MNTRQLPLPFKHAPDYAPDEFLAGPASEAARAWLARPADWPDGRLCLWGDAGSGKTHLLHIWACANGATLLDGSGLDWTHILTDAARPVAIDRADAAPEEELLHALNAAAASGRPVVLVARAPASRWPVSLPDLASRLRTAIEVRVGSDDDGFLAPLFARLLAERQLAVPAALQSWLLHRLPREPAALAEAAATLDQASLAAGGRVSRAIALEVVDGLASIWHSHEV